MWQAHPAQREILSGMRQAAGVVLLRAMSGIIREMKLRPVGKTQWHQFPGTGGITGLCPLAESHLACHTFPEHGSLCLNLFCCVPRAEWDFESLLKQLFEARSVVVRRLQRPYESQMKQAAGD